MKFHLSPHENIFTIALINIHYLYNIQYYKLGTCTATSSKTRALIGGGGGGGAGGIDIYSCSAQLIYFEIILKTTDFKS